MQTAETVGGLYPEEEGVSHWRAVVRSKDSCPVRGGAVGKVPLGNSLAAYSTARCVLRGLGEGDLAWLPGAGNSLFHPYC